MTDRTTHTLARLLSYAYFLPCMNLNLTAGPWRWTWGGEWDHGPFASLPNVTTLKKSPFSALRATFLFNWSIEDRLANPACKDLRAQKQNKANSGASKWGMLWCETASWMPHGTDWMKVGSSFLYPGVSGRISWNDDWETHSTIFSRQWAPATAADFLPFQPGGFFPLSPLGLGWTGGY